MSGPCSNDKDWKRGRGDDRKRLRGAVKSSASRKLRLGHTTREAI